MTYQAQRTLAWSIFVVIAAAVAVFIWLRAAPRTLAQSFHPKGFGYVKIIETPTSLLDGLFFRYNPFYRFEYHLESGYLWSAASYSGESFTAQSADIQWKDSGGAICSLDNLPIFILVGRDWRKANAAEQGAAANP